MDVLSASFDDDKIAWYENDGDESFTAHSITTSARWASSVYAADMDGDGDMDVLSASYDDDEIAWYENDGDESFTAHNIAYSADQALSVYAADLDGDGDVDVLSASQLDDKIAWYENMGTSVNVSDNDLIPEAFALYANYPNPFNPTTTISYDLPEQARATLGIYDILGKQIKTLVNQSQDAGNRIAVWDGTDDLGKQVSAGVYLYRIEAGEFTQTRKMLLLK
jgi:hypothetical protein